jgi:hypothetical protein
MLHRISAPVHPYRQLQYNRNASMKETEGIADPFMLRFIRLAITGLVFSYAAMASLAGYAEDREKQVAHLYFADAKMPFLVGEERVLIDSGDPAAYARQIVRELINGPAGGKRATIPKGTRLRSFFLLKDGTAVVDFSSHLRKNHPGSCRQEQLTLFSVVNSLVLNVPAIDRVKILIDGAEVETLTGHVALEFPLTADMLLTR